MTTSLVRYEALVQGASDETKIGGDPTKGLVLAVLALAEATLLSEPADKIEIFGRIGIDSDGR